MKMNGETTLSTIPRLQRLTSTASKSGSAVDWDSIRQKIQASDASLEPEEEESETAESLEQIWALRAAQIAQVIEDANQGEQIELAVFRLGKEVYGLDVKYVFDIRPVEFLTRLPRVPAWLAGVVNLRGRVVSVLDLQRFLGLPVAQADDTAEQSLRHLVLVETPEMELALLVDEVLVIQSLPVSQIQDANGAAVGIRSTYMRGIVVQAENGDAPNQGNNADSSERPFLVILDLPVLLADKQLIIHEEIV